MIKKFLISLLILSVLASPFAHAQPSTDSRLTQFSTESAAQQHCPSDTVVWLNTKSGIYHFKGQRWYGRTKSGAYVCKQEADTFGDRGPRNGQ
jgi:hypothetical protein